MAVFKQQLYEHCRQLLLDKQRLIRERLQESQDSAANETKSTAGDKHETALAMLQLEQEQLGRQLHDLSEQLNLFDRLSTDVSNERVGPGSLLRTDKGLIYIATAIGRIPFEHQTVIVISPVSPLGQQLLGKRTGDEIVVNGNRYRIGSIS